MPPFGALMKICDVTGQKTELPKWLLYRAVSHLLAHGSAPVRR